MKPFFESSQTLKDLATYLHEQTKNGIVSTPKTTKEPIKLTTEDKKLTEFIEIRAANTLKKMLQKNKAKKQMITSPYDAYLSMVDTEDHLLSSIMFGRHQAEIRKVYKDRISNPYIHDKAFYHRDDELTGLLLDSLMKDFNINDQLKSENIYIPITQLRNTPVEDIIKNHFPNLKPPIELIKSENHSIVLLAMPKQHHSNEALKKVVRAHGLVASPWEIACNVKNLAIELPETPDISKNLKLPNSKEALLASPIFTKLNSIADNKQYATNKLALSLRQLLINLPELDAKAIQRIAMITDMTQTFYENNYQKYAFCLYVVIHEISLALLKHGTEDTQKNNLSQFMTESENTLINALGLKKDQLSQVNFVATPAMSGTNAYSTAMRLASTMQTKTGSKPSIKVMEPHYYEFDFITQTTAHKDADIYVLSAGPIVTPLGVTPGIDINRFVKRNIIDTQREKPVTLVIDATTALYKNFKLNPEVQELIEKGSLSLIIHESHQKFGLLHSDQAQYGRMFGLCSKNSYATEVIEALQKNTQLDFNNHIDMQIGAFISNTCSNTLEEVKQQHFTNGALLRTILVQSKLASKKLIEHEDMLNNLNELYFVTADEDHTPESGKPMKQATVGIVPARDSFGHYHTTKTLVGQTVYFTNYVQIRISPDASDDIDCLIQTSQIYMAQHYTQEQLTDALIKTARQSDSLSIEHQIMALALLNNITADLIVNSKYMTEKRFELLGAMECLMEQCTLLKGRQYHLNARRYVEKLRTEIKKTDGLSKLDIYRKHHDVIDSQKESLEGLTAKIDLLLEKIPQKTHALLQTQTNKEDSNHFEKLKADINEFKKGIIIENPEQNQSQIDYFSNKINDLDQAHQQNIKDNLALEPYAKELSKLIKIFESMNHKIDQEMLRLKSKPDYMNHSSTMNRIDLLREIKETVNINKMRLVHFENNHFLFQNKNPEQIIKEYGELKAQIMNQIEGVLAQNHLEKLTLTTQNRFIALINEKVTRPVLKILGKNTTSERPLVLNKTEAHLIQVGIQFKADLQELNARRDESQSEQEKKINAPK